MKLNYGFAQMNVQNLVVTLNALYLAGYPPLTDLSSVSYFERFKPLASHTMDLNCKLQMDLVKATNTPCGFSHILHIEV